MEVSIATQRLLRTSREEVAMELAGNIIFPLTRTILSNMIIVLDKHTNTTSPTDKISFIFPEFNFFLTFNEKRLI